MKQLKEGGDRTEKKEMAEPNLQKKWISKRGVLSGKKTMIEQTSFQREGGVRGGIPPKARGSPKEQSQLPNV